MERLAQGRGSLLLLLTPGKDVEERFSGRLMYTASTGSGKTILAASVDTREECGQETVPPVICLQESLRVKILSGLIIDFNT